MNTFNIPNPSGGHILKAHDMNFIYDSLKEGFTALSLSRGNAILYGLQHTVFGAGSISYDAGWMMIEGEIYYFAGQNVNLGVYPDPCFVPNETVMSPSPRSMADASSKDIHFKRVVTIENYAAQPVKFRLKELQHFGDAFHTVYAYGTGGVDFEFSNGWAQNGLADFYPLKIRKIGDEIEITGTCKTTAFANNSTVIVLPTRYFGVDYKPSKSHAFVIGARSNISSYTDHHMLAEIDGGELRISSGSYVGTGEIHLFFNHKIKL